MPGQLSVETFLIPNSQSVTPTTPGANQALIYTVNDGTGNTIVRVLFANSKTINVSSSASNDTLVGRATTDNLTNKTLTSPVFAGVASGVALPGTLTAGTSAVMNPFAINTKTTQAHGLGRIPDLINTYIECLSTELGYSVGDRVTLTINGSAAAPVAWTVECDDTNTNLLSATVALNVINKTTPAGYVAATSSKWKLVAIPYIIN